MGTSVCTSCGETVYGTAFCELCGAAATSISQGRAVSESAQATDLAEQQRRVRVAYEKAQQAAQQSRAQYAATPYSPGHTNTLAILSLVLGFMGGGLLSVVLGHIAKSQIRRTRESGDGLATAGLILGYFWLLVSVIFVISSIVSSISFYNSVNSIYVG